MLLLSVCAVGLLSGLVPVVSIEVYLGGIAAVTDLASSPGTAVAIAVAASIGQTTSKVVWYLAASRSMQSAWVGRKLADPRRRAGFDRWQGRIVGRPVLSAVVLLAAATVGFPPLMLIAVVAGSVRVPLALYVPTLLVGRTVRFWLLLTGVGWFADL
jgi:membrane protein YqaA with SNARE-associated domain